MMVLNRSQIVNDGKIPFRPSILYFLVFTTPHFGWLVLHEEEEAFCSIKQHMHKQGNQHELFAKIFDTKKWKW